MEGLGDREALLLAAGYIATTVLMVFNAGVLLVRHRQALEPLQRSSPHDIGDAGCARSTSGMPAGRPTRMTAPAVGLCLSVLAASSSELFLSQVSGEVLRSKPLTSMVAARIACAVTAVPWLLARRFCSKERGEGMIRFNKCQAAYRSFGARNKQKVCPHQDVRCFLLFSMDVRVGTPSAFFGQPVTERCLA